MKILCIRLLHEGCTTSDIMVKVVIGEGMNSWMSVVGVRGGFLAVPEPRSSLGSIWSAVPRVPVVISSGLKRSEGNYILSLIVQTKNG